MLKLCFNEDITIQDLRVVLDISDEVFGPNTDTTQYNPSLEDFFDFHKKFSFCFSVFKHNNKIVGFVTAVPCSNKLKRGFLTGEISEPKLVNLAHLEFNNQSHDALYLMTAYIHEDYRRQGFVKEAFSKIISFYKNRNDNLSLFMWAYSLEGLALGENLSKQFDIKFDFKKYK